jgi:transcription antitermination factor NusG
MATPIAMKPDAAPFRIGQRVRIINERFYNVPGTVASIDTGKSQVRVNVNFFGRNTAVKLGYREIEKV